MRDVNSPPPHILLIENDDVLRRIATGLLKSLGVQVTAVAQGTDVIQAEYAMVLLDCLDAETAGLDFVREWRKREDLWRTPMIGLISAPEEREKCLAAGVDDCLSKPLNYTILRDAIEQWATRPRLVISTRERQRRGLVQEYEGFYDLLRDMIAAFLIEYPLSLQELRGALERGDAAELKALAHKFKGSALTMQSEVVAAAAKSLEMCAKNNDLEAAAGYLDVIAREEETERIFLEAISKETTEAGTHAH